MNQPRINIKWYIVSDILICIFTWVCFYYLRTVIYSYKFVVPSGFYIGLFLYTLGYISLHFLSGTYNSLYGKSRFGEIAKTIAVVIIGCLGLLFFFILKNPQSDNNYYYLEFYSLLIPMLLCTLVVRLIFLNIAKNQLIYKKVYFNTLLIGSGRKASEFYEAFSKTKEQGGFIITCFYETNGKASEIPAGIKKYDKTSNLSTIIKQEKIEEVIIAVDKNERELLTVILQNLSNQEINIKITPDTVDIISGALQTNNILGVPLIDIHSGLLPSWQQNIKRTIDLTTSLAGLILLSPLLLYTLIRVALSSKGNLFYSQVRMGYKGRPFTMYKFRSMYMNAENDGPQLSSDNDNRITKWGKVMRKWRLDELPQLWNICIGEMSLVGPRPERKFYIDQIILRHPEYKYLFKVKPGLTSWGMVKFGYASSVDEMILRMPYDLLYVENVSLALDFKIMLYSVKIILSGKGK
ncbi:MAG: sugar transferase [Ferruginibacter sp.]